MRLKLVNFFFVVAYAATLVCTYLFFIQPPFAYMGLQKNESLSLVWLSLLIVSAASFSFLFPTRIDRPSRLFNALIYMLVYVPSATISYVSLERSGGHWVLFITFSVCMGLMLLISRIHVRSIKTPQLKMKSFQRIFILCAGLSCIFVFSFYRPDFGQIFSLEDISALYDIRSEYRASNITVPGIVQYMFSWLAKFFLPALLVFGLMQRRKKIVVLSFALTFCLFVTSGHKSIFLGSFAICGLWWVMGKKGYITFRSFSGVALSLAVIGLLLSVAGIGFVNEVIIRRTMIIPGVLSGFYFDFFSRNEFAKLGYSVFSSLFNYPYDSSPPFVIGDYYFNRPEMSANVNFIAAGFAEFGVWGAIVFTAIAAYIYKLIDGFSSRTGLQSAALLACLIPTWALVDSALLTTLVTHGLVLLVVFMAVYPKAKNSMAQE